MAAVTGRRVGAFRLSVWFGRAVILAAFLAYLQAAPGRWVNELLVAKPSETLSKLREWMGFGGADAILWDAIGTTLTRALIGLVLGTIAGLIFAFLVWRSKTLALFAEPVVAVLNSVPRIVLIPLFVLWMGSGLGPILAYILGTAFFPMFYNVLQGLRSSDRVMVDSLHILGARERDVVTTYLIPHLREYALTGLMISAPLTLVSTIVGEMLMSAGGLGHILVTSRNDFDTNGIYAATVVAAALGVIANGAVSSWNKRGRTRALERGSL